LEEVGQGLEGGGAVGKVFDFVLVGSEGLFEEKFAETGEGEGWGGKFALGFGSGLEVCLFYFGESFFLHEEKMFKRLSGDVLVFGG